MAVRQRPHPLAGIHQLFAILGFFGEIDEHEPEPLELAEPEVGNIPARFWGKRPAVRRKAGRRLANEFVDVTAFHGVWGNPACPFLLGICFCARRTVDGQHAVGVGE